MRTRRDLTLIVTVCAAYAIFLVATRPPTPITAPDTSVYLETSPLVPVGYPLILKAIGVDGVALVQPVLFAVALASLGVELLLLTGSLALALAVLVGILCTPEMATFHASILTESFFVSGLVGFLAAVTRFARAPSWQTACVAATIAAFTATIRRTAYAFAPVLVVMIVFERRQLAPRGWRALAAAVVPLAVITAADHAITARIHGDARTSLTGRHLFAKAALLDAPPAARSGDPVQALMEHQLDVTYQPIRALIADAPSDIRASLILYYETCLQGPCVTALRDAIALPDAIKNERLAGVGAARIVRAPFDFTWLTLGHYGSLWTAYKVQHPATSARLTAFLAAHRPLPFEREAFKVGPDEPITFAPSPAVRWLQPVIIGVGLFTAGIAVIGAVSAARGEVSAVLLAATYASLTAHGSLLFSALAAAGISRFMIAVFPAVVTSTTLGIWWVGAKWLGRARHARYD